MKTLPASQFRHGISMSCGCTASGTLSINGSPALVGCGLHGCTEVVDAPALTGRTATCCSKEPVPSEPTLPFFEHRPKDKRDRYYCGHGGWD